MRRALRDVLEMDLPNMVQMDCSLLSGLLAEALLRKTPKHLNAIFFCNSGTEAVEGAIQFVCAATGRSGLVSLEKSFHGLSNGALSVMGDESFREGFGALLENCERVKMGDLERLDEILRRRTTGGLLIEPVQGKGVYFPQDDFYRRRRNCVGSRGRC